MYVANPDIDFKVKLLTLLTSLNPMLLPAKTIRAQGATQSAAIITNQIFFFTIIVFMIDHRSRGLVAYSSTQSLLHIPLFCVQENMSGALCMACSA